MNPFPKVSVIVPVYNVEEYLQKCIDSLVNQTLSEIELIFVNDASTDNSLNILIDNQKKYPDKIKVINSLINLKQGGARNLGIKEAKAEYIGFVDSDDYVNEDMFEKLYVETVKSSSDVTFIQASAFQEAKGGITPFVKWSSFLLSHQGQILTDDERVNFIASVKGGIWSGLWRKELLVSNNITFPEKIRFEDNYWGSLVSAYIDKYSLVEEVGYNYRLNPNSTIHKRNSTWFADRVIAERMLLREVKNRKIWDRFFSAWEWIYIYRYGVNTFYGMLSLMDVPDYNLLYEVIDDLKTQFPNWEKNTFFRQQMSLKRKLMAYAAIYFPQPVARVSTWIFRIKRKINKYNKLK